MRFHATLAAIVLSFVTVSGAAHAMPPRRPVAIAAAAPLRLHPERHAELKANAALLHSAETPGYAVLFKGGKGARAYQGGALVATVVPGTFKAWMNKVGKQSIGFHDNGTPDDYGGSGMLRVGDQYYPYFAINEGGSPEKMDLDITGTEVTFMVTPAEMGAFKAFYRARSLRLITDKRGEVMAPEFNGHGPSNTKQEGCTGACTSSMNPRWTAAFKRNIPALRKYGQQHNIPDLAAITDDAADVIEAFTARTGASQQTSSKVLVRSHFGKSSMVTVFNRYQAKDPISTLAWRSSGDWGVWNGLGTPALVPDAPNDKPKATVQTQRIPLKQFIDE
jgi:hypothetical protein